MENIRTVIETDKLGNVLTFATDQEFINYARKVYDENEKDTPYPTEIYWKPENIQQATEYIGEYCGNLELTEL